MVTDDTKMSTDTWQAANDDCSPFPPLWSSIILVRTKEKKKAEVAQPIRLFISWGNARVYQAAGKGHLFTIWSALYRSCSFHCQRSWAQGEMGKIQYLSICFVIKFLNLQRELFFFFHCHLQEKNQNLWANQKRRKLALYLHVELVAAACAPEIATHGFIQMYNTRWGTSQREQEPELWGAQEQSERELLKILHWFRELLIKRKESSLETAL